MTAASESRYSPETLRKAVNLIAEDKIEEDLDHQRVWWVQGRSSKKYRVQIGMTGNSVNYITCTCPHGINVGAGDTRCYHSAAVLMLLADEAERKAKAESTADPDSADIVDLNLKRAGSRGNLLAEVRIDG